MNIVLVYANKKAVVYDQIILLNSSWEKKDCIISKIIWDMSVILLWYVDEKLNLDSLAEVKFDHVEGGSEILHAARQFCSASEKKPQPDIEFEDQSYAGGGLSPQESWQIALLHSRPHESRNADEEVLQW